MSRVPAIGEWIKYELGPGGGGEAFGVCAGHRGNGAILCIVVTKLGAEVRDGVLPSSDPRMVDQGIIGDNARLRGCYTLIPGGLTDLMGRLDALESKLALLTPRVNKVKEPELAGAK